MRGIDYTNSFLVKVWLTMNPLKGLILSFSFYIALNSYLLFLVERSAGSYNLMSCYEADKQESMTRNYKDAIWLTIITFMTVGFGDFYPITNQGRFIMMITVFGG